MLVTRNHNLFRFASRVSIPAATCSNRITTCNCSQGVKGVKVATMSTAAISQQPPQHLSQPDEADSPNHLSDSETPSSSPKTSRSGSSSRTRTTQNDRAASQRMSGYFPLGYKEAAYQWWASLTPLASERNVLNFVPFLREAVSDSLSSDVQNAERRDPFGHRIWRSTMVALSGKNRSLNEYSVERVGESADETLVMLHGYGAGLGFFYQNFEPITRVEGWRLYALDMLGMGNSSRPAFRIKEKDPKDKVKEAESFFIDALEEWRKIRKIEKFTLLGHSLGGYLATAYALKYPGHLNKLILASPVGIPEDPFAAKDEMPEPTDSTLANEFTQSQNTIVHQDKQQTGPKAPRRPLPGWLVWLWDTNCVSPFSLVRMGGPLGPRFVSGWTSRRFNHLPAEESAALHAYSYNLFRQKGSGEFALTYILAPGAYARNPLINRIGDVGRQVIKSAADGQAETRETGFPVVLMYGDSDWMDVAGGFAAEEKIKARVEKALMEGSDEERRDENGSARVIVVRKAGHHLYLDNPDEFNEHIVKELEETRDYNRRRRAQGLA